MLHYYHFKCILTLITLTLILNLALTFSLTLSRIVHSSFTSFRIFIVLVTLLIMHRKLITKYAPPFRSKRGFWELLYVQSKEIIPWANLYSIIKFTYILREDYIQKCRNEQLICSQNLFSN